MPAAVPFTAMVSELVLLALAGSGSAASTLATLVIVPPVAGRTTTLKVALAPEAMLGWLHTTAPALCVHEGDTQTRADPAGTAWLAWTPVATAGPALFTVRVMSTSL